MAPHKTLDHSEEAPPSSGGAIPGPGAVLDDKFRIERRLGAGGMGAVYEVTHLLTKHRRALKLLHPEIARKKVAVERFFREASAAGRIGNAHIVETFDAGWLSSGEPYLLMELLDGVPLTRRIAEQPEGMDVDEVLEIAAQLGKGIQAAHDAGIVHRDLKPDNVFLARANGAWLVKVLDFGVSKFDAALATRLTSESSMVGTPAYMSPEQFEGGTEVGPASDQYAIGLILYEMLTGRYPHPIESLTQLMKQVLLGEPPRVGERRAGLPKAVDAVIVRMLDPNPTLRFDSAPRAIEALTIAFEGHGILRRTALSDPRELDPNVTAPVQRTEFAELVSTQVVEEADESVDGDKANDEVDPAIPIRSPRAAYGVVGLVVAGAAIALAAMQLGETRSPSWETTASPPATASPSASAAVSSTSPRADLTASAPPTPAAATATASNQTQPATRPPPLPPTSKPTSTPTSGPITVGEAFDD